MRNFFESLIAWLSELLSERTVDTAIGALMGAATVTIIAGVIAWWRQKKAEEIARTDAINRTLFLLLRKLNNVITYRLEIERHLLEGNGDMRLVPPVMPFEKREEFFELGNMSWILRTKYRNILIEIMSGLDAHQGFILITSHRNQVWLDKIRPYMDGVSDKGEIISRLEQIPSWLRGEFNTYNRQVQDMLFSNDRLELKLENIYSKLRDVSIKLGYKDIVPLAGAEIISKNKINDRQVSCVPSKNSE